MDYIPSKDSGFDAWANNFSDTINVDPTAYGLDAADGTAISDSVASWNTAYAQTQDPSTRTSPKIAAKDNQRTLTERLLRSYAMIIQTVDSVTDEQLVDAGLTVRKETPTPGGTPTDIPSIEFEGERGGELCFRLGNATTPDSDALPNNASSIVLTGTLLDSSGNPDPSGRTSTWICKPGQNYIPRWYPDPPETWRWTAKFLAKSSNDKGWKESGPQSNAVDTTLA